MVEVFTAIMAVATVGMSAMKASNDLSNAKKSAQATVNAAKINAENKAKHVKAMAASQKVSFLTSGLTLEGTPLAVLSSTYETGRQDINQIIQNANTSSKNTMSQARSQALSGMMNGLLSAGTTAFGDKTSGSTNTTGSGIDYGNGGSFDYSKGSYTYT